MVITIFFGNSYRKILFHCIRILSLVYNINVQDPIFSFLENIHVTYFHYIHILSLKYNKSTWCNSAVFSIVSITSLHKTSHVQNPILLFHKNPIPLYSVSILPKSVHVQGPILLFWKKSYSTSLSCLYNKIYKLLKV